MKQCTHEPVIRVPCGTGTKVARVGMPLAGTNRRTTGSRRAKRTAKPLRPSAEEDA